MHKLRHNHMIKYKGTARVKEHESVAGAMLPRLWCASDFTTDHYKKQVVRLYLSDRLDVHENCTVVVSF